MWIFTKIIMILGCIFIFFLNISNVVFSYFFYFKYDYDNNFIISEIDNSINGKLIESIEFRKVCKGLEEKIILGIWDGTKEGCDCRGIVYKGICSDKQTSNGCIPLYSNPPISYTYINSNNICAKMSELNYKELIKKKKVISKEEICPKDYKSCGILDSFGRKLCVKIDESCPINTFTIKEKLYNFLINRNLLT